MNFDQYDDEQVPNQVAVTNERLKKLSEAVSLLINSIYDNKGRVVDITDRQGRERLENAIKSIPKEIPTALEDKDRAILEKSTKSLYKFNHLFWWAIGLGSLGIALTFISIWALIEGNGHLEKERAVLVEERKILEKDKEMTEYGQWIYDQHGEGKTYKAWHQQRGK